MTFEQFFERHNWWNENSRRDGMQLIWDALTQRHKLSGADAAEVIESVMFQIRDEYGE